VRWLLLLALAGCSEYRHEPVRVIAQPRPPAAVPEPARAPASVPRAAPAPVIAEQPRAPGFEARPPPDPHAPNGNEAFRQAIEQRISR
jgi:hypothetical protein